MNQNNNNQHDLLILYGSQTGNAAYLAEEVEREAIRRNFKCYINSCDGYNVKDLPNEKHVIFVISTTGQGDCPDNMIKFWQFLLIKELPKDSLKNMRFTVFGLGDSNYQLFCASARKLHRRVLDLGATEFVERGLGDDQHPQGYYNAFDVWMGQLWESLKKEFPDKIQEETSQQNEKPPIPRFKIKYIQEDEQMQQEVSQSYKYLHKTHGVQQQYNPCLLKNKESLTPPLYERQTFKVDFNIENQNMKYNPGDILVVHPSNDTQLSLNLAEILNLDLGQIIEIEVNPDHPSKFINPFPKYLRIFDLFVQWLDIQSYPTRYFLKLMSFYTDDELHKEKLQEMSAMNLEGAEEFHDYIVRERRNIHEILFDFQSVKNFPPEYLLESVSLLVPRKYSISSSQLKDKNLVSMTIGMVKYKTLFNRNIIGICSKYIESLALKQRVLLQIQPGTMPFPKDLTTPVIMVGPGTGVAPFISFIDERVQMIENAILNNNKPNDLHQKTILFFGCRHKEKDFYYGQNLESLHELNMLSLYTAFSRDGKEKVYVQHLIEKNWQSLFQIIQKNFETVKIFVAGTSKFMPQQVEEAFTNVIYKGNKQNDMQQAKNIIEYLKKKKQYVLEAW